VKALVLNSYALVAAICAALLVAEAVHAVFAPVSRLLVEVMPK
jgi:hypothetical protein